MKLTYTRDFSEYRNGDVALVGGKNASLRKEEKKPIGICGQAPSDFPEFAEWLVTQGIDSISLNPDTAIKTALRVAAAEQHSGARAAA